LDLLKKKLFYDKIGVPILVLGRGADIIVEKWQQETFFPEGAFPSP
jgi:hypothetical protein